MALRMEMIQGTGIACLNPSRAVSVALHEAESLHAGDRGTAASSTVGMQGGNKG